MSRPPAQDTGTAPTLIHLGYPKGASTWLQKHFFQPQLGYGQISNSLYLHRDLVHPEDHEVDVDSQRQAIHSLLQEQRSRGLQPVISSEGLCGDLLRGGWNSERIADRLAAVAASDARFLLVVREQRDLLRSLYKTLIMFGSDRPLKKMLTVQEGVGDRHFHLGFLKFDRLLALYSQRFGPEAVLALPYELFRSQPREFLSAINRHGLRPEVPDDLLAQLPWDVVANPGESLVFLDAQRWWNKLRVTSSQDYLGRGECNSFDRVMRRISWHKRHGRPTPLDDWLEERFRLRVAGATEGLFCDSNRALQAFCPVDLAQYGYQL